MKILLLNYEFPPLGGGASSVSYELAKGYAQSGHTVDVITMGYGNLPALETKGGVMIRRLRCWRSKKEICYPWEQLSYLVSAAFYLRKAFKGGQYDVCHCHFIIPTGILARWLKRTSGLEYVVTSHGSDVLGYNPRFRYLYPFFKQAWISIINDSKYLVAPSEFLKDKILAVHPRFDKNKLRIIPNGIEKNRFRPGEKVKSILLVSRLFKNKGIQVFFDALSAIHLNDWQIDIVGEGPYKNILIRQAKRLRLNVVFHGWLDNASVVLKKIYGSAKIFVSPSFFESFGINVVEAMQAGAVPLVSDIPSYRSIVQEEAFLFPVGDAEGLGRKLSSLLRREDLDTLGAHMTERANTTYAREKIIDQYLQLLEDHD